jgi:hypothetical protein
MQELTLTQAINASVFGRSQRVIIKAGTGIKLLEVDEGYAKFDVAPRVGYHETTQLAELCAALGLGS